MIILSTLFAQKNKTKNIYHLEIHVREHTYPFNSLGYLALAAKLTNRLI